MLFLFGWMFLKREPYRSRIFPMNFPVPSSTMTKAGLPLTSSMQHWRGLFPAYRGAALGSAGEQGRNMAYMFGNTAFDDIRREVLVLTQGSLSGDVLVLDVQL